MLARFATVRATVSDLRTTSSAPRRDSTGGTHRALVSPSPHADVGPGAGSALHVPVVPVTGARARAQSST